MMDILDILLSKSSGGGAATSDMTARKNAKQASKDAALANTIANNALVGVEEIRNSIPEIEIEKNNDDAAIDTEIKINNEKANIKNYKTTGQNEDGSMTQKAITNMFEELDSKIDESESNVNMGEDNSGNIVIIGEDGTLQPGNIDELSLINTQIAIGTYSPEHSIGLEIDYENKTFKRLNSNINPNQLSVYKNINRCLVDDNGEIICFYGEDIYTDNYSSGYQTMVYIPKFYYMRIPTKVENQIIKKDVLYISDKAQTGFKVHPIFINADGQEVDYFLYSAYEGSTFDVSANNYNRNDGIIDFNEDKLSSIVEAKPISGANNDLTINSAEKLAQNRGSDWHITSIKAESALQMLMCVEFGTLNIQQALEMGISSIENIPNYNCSSYTGATANLGNITGAAETTNERNGLEYVYNEDGLRAISYRGIENPYGNLWRFVGGLQIRGFGVNNGGTPYICEGLHYDSDTYKSVGFNLPNNSDWISAFGYADEEFDWLFIPIEANNGSSLLPVGDAVWTQANLNGVNIGTIGGYWTFKEYNGIFYYGFDKSTTYSSRAFGARLMLVPTKNEIYESNLTSIGG